MSVSISRVILKFTEQRKTKRGEERRGEGRPTLKLGEDSFERDGDEVFKNILNRRPLSLFLTSTCELFNPENTEEERQTKIACAGRVDYDEEAKPVNFMEKKTS